MPLDCSVALSDRVQRHLYTYLLVNKSTRTIFQLSINIDLSAETFKKDPDHHVRTADTTRSPTELHDGHWIKPASTHLEVPGARNGVPPQHRRSMEDEHRPLPAGWIRQFDLKEQHQFFVDTKANPPRSIWQHPYDDETYLSSISSEERERIEEEERERKHLSDNESAGPSLKVSAAGIPSQHTASSSFAPDLPPRPSSVSDPKAKKGFGEKLKEKVTGLNREERAEYKRQLEQQEREYYEAHMRFRQCLQRAQMTGQPQFFAKDRNGQEIYIEPPNTGYNPYGAYNNGYGYNPYTSGPYSNPNARFIRPQGPYNRPYGPAYGGGYGMPIAGGLLGGMLLGGLLF